MKHISIKAFKEVLNAEKHNPTVDFINVCTPAEYKEKHIRGVRSVPLDSLESHKDTFATKKTIYIHCRSGKRGQAAIEKLSALGVTAELVNVEGGIIAWDEAGHETGSHTTQLPLMRQTFLAAGALVFLGVTLTLTVHHFFILIPLGVSLGLMVSGATGWCGMQIILSKMPWNKN